MVRAEAGAAPPPPASADKDEPRAWQSDAEARRWRLRYRGTGRRRRTPVTVEVALDAEQTAWASDAAQAAGLPLDDFILKLIDEARGAPKHLNGRREAAARDTPGG
jgi:hypothetical protein